MSSVECFAGRFHVPVAWSTSRLAPHAPCSTLGFGLRTLDSASYAHRRHRPQPSLLARRGAGTIRLCRGAHSRHAPVAARTQGIADEAVILSTCNRVEIYAATSAGTGRRLHRTEAVSGRTATITAIRSTDEIYTLTEPQSVEHLFRVACGLDSMVLGETEILGQLKKAYDLALQHRHTGQPPEQGLPARLQRGQARPHRNQHPARQRLRRLRGRRTGGKDLHLARPTATSWSSAPATPARKPPAPCSRAAPGASSSPTARYDRAVALAAELGGRAVRFDDWSGEFEHIDIAISSTSAPHHILDRAQLEPLMKLRAKPSAAAD